MSILFPDTHPGLALHCSPAHLASQLGSFCMSLIFSAIWDSFSSLEGGNSRRDNAQVPHPMTLHIRPWWKFPQIHHFTIMAFVVAFLRYPLAWVLTMPLASPQACWLPWIPALFCRQNLGLEGPVPWGCITRLSEKSLASQQELSWMCICSRGCLAWCSTPTLLSYICSMVSVGSWTFRTERGFKEHWFIV